MSMRDLDDHRWVKETLDDLPICCNSTYHLSLIVLPRVVLSERQAMDMKNKGGGGFGVILRINMQRSLETLEADDVSY